MERTKQRRPRELGWIFVAMVTPGAAMWLSFYGLPPQWTAVIYAFSKVVVIALPLWVMRPSFQRPPKPQLADAAWGLAVGCLVGGLALAIYFGDLGDRSEFRAAAVAIQAKMKAAHVTSTARFVLVALFISIGNSTLEEYFWRWFAYGRLRDHWSRPTAAITSSLLFGVHHFVVLSHYFHQSVLTMALPLSGCTILGGLIWCALYERRGTLYAAWLSHLLIDAAIMVIGFELLQR